MLEDLYLPFKPKRRTKAMIARERGLGAAGRGDPRRPRGTRRQTLAAGYLGDEVPDAKEALAGARDILAEGLSEDAALIGRLRTFLQRDGVIAARVMEGQEEKGAKFSDYFAHTERWAGAPSHRALAMMRGAQRGRADARHRAGRRDGDCRRSRRWSRARSGSRGDAPGDRWLREVGALGVAGQARPVDDARPDGHLRERAQEEAIRVFARNLKDLLLAAPAGARATMGLDPGIRTGVKVAVVDATGKLLATDTVYPFQPQERRARGAGGACGADRASTGSS